MTTATIARPVGSPRVLGVPAVLLRLEGLAILAAAAAVYATVGASWGSFAALFLLPDLGLLGYLANPSVGATTYNTTHSLLGPALLLATSFAIDASTGVAVALVWVAHIGFDRALGYGLKYGTGFKHTHLT